MANIDNIHHEGELTVIELSMPGALWTSRNGRLMEDFLDSISEGERLELWHCIDSERDHALFPSESAAQKYEKGYAGTCRIYPHSQQIENNRLRQQSADLNRQQKLQSDYFTNHPVMLTAYPDASEIIKRPAHRPKGTTGAYKEPQDIRKVHSVRATDAEWEKIKPLIEKIAPPIRGSKTKPAE